MSKNHPQVSAFVLHARPYQENSQIIQIFSRELGRFSLIAKGIKGKSSQAKKALMQPFIQLDITYTGKSELKTLIQCEVSQNSQQDKLNNYHQHIVWQGKTLACGYYINELVLRACPEKHEFFELFDCYQKLVAQLGQDIANNNALLYPALRKFEVILLTLLGIAPDWQYDIEQELIKPDKYYQFIAKQGFALSSLSFNNKNKANYARDSKVNMHEFNQHEFSGQSILDLANGDYNIEHYKTTQKLTQLLLQEVIGNKPLQSRKLWQHMALRF